MADQKQSTDNRLNENPYINNQNQYPPVNPSPFIYPNPNQNNYPQHQNFNQPPPPHSNPGYYNNAGQNRI